MAKTTIDLKKADWKAMYAKLPLPEFVHWALELLGIPSEECDVTTTMETNLLTITITTTQLKSNKVEKTDKVLELKIKEV
jgi:hypothetical protein